MKSNISSLLGIAQKANKLVSGEYIVEQAIRTNKAFLVIISNDASVNTKDNFYSMCDTRKIPVYFLGDCKSLGKSIGKKRRKLIAITDKGIAKTLIERINHLTGVGNIEEKVTRL